MANGVYKITDDFEKELGRYTGAPYVVTLDNMSNALFLSLYYQHYVIRRTVFSSIKTNHFWEDSRA